MRKNIVVTILVAAVVAIVVALGCFSFFANRPRKLAEQEAYDTLQNYIKDKENPSNLDLLFSVEKSDNVFYFTYTDGKFEQLNVDDYVVSIKVGAVTYELGKPTINANNYFGKAAIYDRSTITAAEESAAFAMVGNVIKQYISDTGCSYEDLDGFVFECDEIYFFHVNGSHRRVFVVGNKFTYPETNGKTYTLESQNITIYGVVFYKAI